MERALPYIERLVPLLKEEMASETIGRLPSQFYREALGTVADFTLGEIDTDSLYSRLMSRRRQLLSELLSKLLMSRVTKMIDLLLSGKPEDIPWATLPDEEKYILEPLLEFERRLFIVRFALKNVRVSALSRIKEELSGSRLIVRCLKPIDQVTDTDLRTYGPVKEGDVLTLPIETAHHLKSMGSVDDVFT
ncbi:MAG: hypothetical protein C4339_00745 [Nitrososphaerota archaeon]